MYQPTRYIYVFYLTDFGRNHKAKLWSLEVVGELNNIPVKISLPTQVNTRSQYILSN